MKILRNTLLLWLTLSLLAGCKNLQPRDRGEIASKTKEQQELLEDFRSNVAPASSGMQYEEGLQLGLVSHTNNNFEKLPANLRRDGAFVWRSNHQADLPSILGRLSNQTGIQHYLFVGPEQKQVSIGGDFVPDVNSGIEGGDNSSSGLLAEHGLNSFLKPDFSGSLDQILDEVSTLYDLAWIYKDRSIYLNQFDLKSYSLELLPTRTSSSSTIGATTTSIDLDLLTEIQNSLRNLLGQEEMLIAEKGTGTLLLNARPSTHGRVAKYIKQINTSLGQQVAIDVSILTMNLDEAQGMSTALSIAGEGSAGSAFNLVETSSLTGASTLANVGLLSGDISVKVFLSILNRRGNVVVETRTGATTSNNRLVPIQVVREIAFAKTVESVAEESGANLARITPGQLSTGFEMTLLPKVLNNLEILLHYNVKISDLNELKEFTSNNQTIQLPNVSTTEFEQQTILGNGETLVLAGFERERFTANHKKGGLLSRQTLNETQKVATVILIRPRLLKRKTL